MSSSSYSSLEELTKYIELHENNLSNIGKQSIKKSIKILSFTSDKNLKSNSINNENNLSKKENLHHSNFSTSNSSLLKTGNAISKSGFSNNKLNIESNIIPNPLRASNQWSNKKTESHQLPPKSQKFKNENNQDKRYINYNEKNEFNNNYNNNNNNNNEIIYNNNYKNLNENNYNNINKTNDSNFHLSNNIGHDLSYFLNHLDNFRAIRNHEFKKVSQLLKSEIESDDVFSAYDLGLDLHSLSVENIGLDLLLQDNDKDDADDNNTGVLEDFLLGVSSSSNQFRIFDEENINNKSLKSITTNNNINKSLKNIKKNDNLSICYSDDDDDDNNNNNNNNNNSIVDLVRIRRNNKLKLIASSLENIITDINLHNEIMPPKDIDSNDGDENNDTYSNNVETLQTSLNNSISQIIENSNGISSPFKKMNIPNFTSIEKLLKESELLNLQIDQILGRKNQID